jgi:2-polyprenyl-6-methoxyphenol hydroxylase-like FAD-dependent oxidoreductase
MTVIEATPTHVRTVGTAPLVRSTGRVHVVGAGPIGLFLTALLQSVDGQKVRLYEKREDYTRSRMVSLAEYLVADSIDSYKADPIDRLNVEAIFDDSEIQKGIGFRRGIAPDLRALLEEWTCGFVPLNTIERALSGLIDSRGTGTVERVARSLDADQALAMLEPDDLLIDCTGSRSMLRDLLLPGTDLAAPGRNTAQFRMEYALVVTFLYDRNYECNEYCKYYKNVDNVEYKFIPAVRRTCYDGSITHVTGIVTISEAEFEATPSTCDGTWLREHLPEVARSMDRFIDKIKAESHGEVVGDIQVVRIPLDLYRARNVTSREWRYAGIDHPLAQRNVFLLGDAALGSPYFQSISLGVESAFFLAGHIANRSLPVEEIFYRYEAFMYQQWLRVYMRTRMIKHNKDLLASIDDAVSLLENLHVY